MFFLIQHFTSVFFEISYHDACYSDANVANDVQLLIEEVCNCRQTVLDKIHQWFIIIIIIIGLNV